MTSSERHEQRYQRRKAKREEKIRQKSKATGDFDETFSFRHLYLSGKKCTSNLLWKNSTQRFIGTLPLMVSEVREQLMAGTFKGKGFIHFIVMERGKLRHIRSVHITERMVQKTLCDYCIVPVFSSAFVYDNGASLKGKGIDFSMDRLSTHLQRHFRRYGRQGGVLLYDFSGYFDNAAHEPLFEESEHRLHDLRTRELSDSFIKAFGPVGLGLGSQVSQTNALLLPNPIDHYIKEVLRIKGYGRYMDDGYLIHQDMAYLEYCRDELIRVCAERGLVINPKKTRIVPLTKPITYLKTRFILTESGKVIRKMNKHSTKTARKKLRIFKKWVEAGKMSMSDVRCFYDSYHGHMERGNSHKILEKTDHYFKELYGFYPNKKGWMKYVQNHQGDGDLGNGGNTDLDQSPRERLLRLVE